MLIAVLYILIVALPNSKFIWILSQFLFTKLVTSNLLANYQLPIHNYQCYTSFNRKLLHISPLSQIALVADTIRYSPPLMMGVTHQVLKTLILPITSRLRGYLWSKVKVSRADRPRKHLLSDTYTQTLQRGSKFLTKQ
jgi:hypothetical protein